jgi:hypothetical protein
MSDEQAETAAIPTSSKKPARRKETEPILAKNTGDNHVYVAAGCCYPGEVAVVTTEELADNPTMEAIRG